MSRRFEEKVSIVTGSGGGIGEGILPLSLAYSAILGSTPDVYVAQLAPAAVLGNIFAIVTAGVLARPVPQAMRCVGRGDGGWIRLCTPQTVRICAVCWRTLNRFAIKLPSFCVSRATAACQSAPCVSALVTTTFK